MQFSEASTDRSSRARRFPFRELDPRVKLLGGFIFLALVVSLRNPVGLGAALLAIGLLARYNGLSWGYLGRRLLVTLPFTGFFLVFQPFTYPGGGPLATVVGLVIIREGLEAAGIIALRVAAAVCFLSTLMACTTERELWLGMQGLRIPAPIAQLFLFILRYLRVLTHDLQALQVACTSRGFRPGRSLAHRQTFRLLGEMLGAFLVRSVGRAEIVYLALVSRGLEGEAAAAEQRRLAPGDWLPGGLLAGLGLVLFLVDRVMAL